MIGIYLILALLALCLFALLIMVLRLQRQQAASLQQIEQLKQRNKQQVTQLAEEIYEVRSGNMGMGNKLNQLAEQIVATNKKQQELADRDPDSRLYSKATKLVNAGASIDEVMHECELPRAEAELLFSLHKK